MKNEPCARLMMPRIPKISVSPEATRNSSRPYCTPLRSWMAMKAVSTARSSSGDGASGARVGDRLLRDRDDGVVSVPHLANIDILDRIVRLRERPAPARAVELHGRHCGDQGFRCPGVALHL